ncbi:MAG: protein phosphatase 2C domain-containing protein [Verrucomicrobiota bacterium]
MPEQSIEIQWSAHTDTGRFRKNNEDAFLALAVDNQQAQRLGKEGSGSCEVYDFVFAVSDGMGGANAGEFASQIATDRITRLFPQSFRSAATGLDWGFKDVMEELFDSIHHDLGELGKSYDECSGMGATLSLGWLGPEWFLFGHVGDSRIYHIPKNEGIQQISHDHTHTGWLERQGKLNEREARTHPRRNSLQQALGGSTQFLDPHIGAIRHEPGDTFLFCSDGLIDGIWNRRLEELIRAREGQSVEDLAPQLVRFSVEASGKDNTTAIIVSIN